jgi:hypothetical protein
MNRKDFFALALGTGLAVCASRVLGSVALPESPMVLTEDDIIDAPEDLLATPAVSGHIPEAGVIWCACPNCNGVGFVGGEDSCGYCKTAGMFTRTDTSRFGMYGVEGGAEVWRALVWHEWSVSNYYREDKGPKPYLAGMLCNIGDRHPEVYDTAVRECLFTYLEAQHGKAHAEAQLSQWYAEVEKQNREDARYKSLYARDDAAKFSLA